MIITVPIQMVPDLIEELVIDSTGAALDTFETRWIPNEFDEAAVEQAILLKERLGGQVVVIAPDFDGADDALFTAAAKGADRLIKITGVFENVVNTHALARVFSSILKDISPDLVLTGVQTHHSLDGSVGPFLAESLGMPYTGYIAGITITGKTVVARKEFPGGLAAEMTCQLPVILGIQAADTPPRYVPISKLRQVMKTSRIEEIDAGALGLDGGVAPDRLFQPEVAAKATMLEGDVDQVAARMVEILKEQGVM